MKWIVLGVGIITENPTESTELDRFRWFGSVFILKNNITGKKKAEPALNRVGPIFIPFKPLKTGSDRIFLFYFIF